MLRFRGASGAEARKVKPRRLFSRDRSFCCIHNPTVAHPPAHDNPDQSVRDRLATIGWRFVPSHISRLHLSDPQLSFVAALSIPRLLLCLKPANTWDVNPSRAVLFPPSCSFRMGARLRPVSPNLSSPPALAVETPRSCSWKAIPRLVSSMKAIISHALRAPPPDRWRISLGFLMESLAPS